MNVMLRFGPREYPSKPRRHLVVPMCTNPIIPVCDDGILGCTGYGTYHHSRWYGNIPALGAPARPALYFAVEATHPHTAMFLLHTESTMAPQLTLTYFNIPGRAELSRLTFVAGGIAFDDYRTSVSEDDFATCDLKPKMPLGQLPVLDVDGHTYPQSLAIARYAAKLGGLYPEDPLEALKLDAVLETVADLRNAVGDIRWGVNDEATKTMKTKKLLEETLPMSLRFVEKSLVGTFLYGDKLSLADIAIFDIEKNSIRAGFPDFDVTAYPKIATLIAGVKANERIAAYLAK